MSATETYSTVLPKEWEERTARLLGRACDLELSLATAESCTGGMLGSLLTDVEGASRAFKGGLIAYSLEAKEKLLGVPRAMTEPCNAVSQEVAIAMAEGGLKRTDADICLAVTGFAGPSGPRDEIGLVHFACARRNRPTSAGERHFGDIGRGPTRIECLKMAITMIEEALV